MTADLKFLCSQIIKPYFCKKQKAIISDDDNLTPSNTTMIRMINRLIKQGCTKQDIFLDFTEGYSGKRLQRQKELYYKVMSHSEINTVQLEKNEVTSNVLSYLGFDTNPNQTIMEFKK